MLCLRTWSQIQDNSIGTEQNLKTGKGEFDYSSRATGSWRPIDSITVILAHFRGGVADIYAQKKLDELDKELETQNWEEFVKEIKTMFSDKTKAVDAKWRIESFKQGKKNMADFMIEFEALAMKTDTDKLHAIFLLKKNVQQDIIKTILGYPPIATPELLKE